jgi:hypothetical protein
VAICAVRDQQDRVAEEVHRRPDRSSETATSAPTSSRRTPTSTAG